MDKPKSSFTTAKLKVLLKDYQPSQSCTRHLLQSLANQPENFKPPFVNFILFLVSTLCLLQGRHAVKLINCRNTLQVSDVQYNPVTILRSVTTDTFPHHNKVNIVLISRYKRNASHTCFLVCKSFLKLFAGLDDHEHLLPAHTHKNKEKASTRQCTGYLCYR